MTSPAKSYDDETIKNQTLAAGVQRDVYGVGRITVAIVRAGERGKLLPTLDSNLTPTQARELSADLARFADEAERPE